MKVIIIAEAGVNHNGDFELAKQLVDKAAWAGADYVKFQTFKAKNIATKKVQKADYQEKNGAKGDNQYKMLKKLELSYERQRELCSYAQSKGIKFLSTAFDLESADFLNDLDLPLFKIPSGEITNFPYLVKIASFGKPVVISTGMSTLEEIEDSLNVFLEENIPLSEITILHCSTEYPTPMKNVNLNAMNSIQKKFKVNIGYSDHTLGIEIPIAAVAMGAKLIEKHFTLDKSMEGPDHKASLEPSELKAMIDSIRNIEMALGDGIKSPSSTELENRKVARKSIVASMAIKKGQFFSEENLTTKRAGEGISPMNWKMVLGKKAVQNFEADELIKL